MQACVIALLAALVTACAVLTPLQQRAIDQASARVQLGRASASAEVLQLESSGFLSSFYTGGGQPAQALTPDQLYDEVPAPIAQAFGRPIGGQYLRVSMSDPRPSEGVLAWRTDACAHVRLVTGQCPEGARQIAVSTADAHLFGWDVGATVTVLEVQPSDAREKPRRMALTVAGTYAAPEDHYWDTWVLTGVSGTRPDRDAPVQHDLWLTDQATFEEAPTWRNPSSRTDLRLRHAVTGVDELLTLGRRISDLARTEARRPPLLPVVTVRSELPAVADSVRDAQDQSRVTIPALIVPLGALGLVVLWMALGTAVEQRRPEVALARLRGRGVRGAQAHLVRELLLIVLVGVPVGALAAVGVSWPAQALLLPRREPVEVFRAPVLLALGLSALLVSAAVLLATTAVSREPIVALMRRIPPRRSRWGVGTSDAVVVTVAASILGSFATGHLTGPIALVAPAVLAFGCGLVLARLLVPAATRAGRALLVRGRPGSGVGLLQLARRPGLRSTAALLTVAAAILVFAGDAVAVGGRNRALAAAQSVGAPVVLTVRGGSSLDVRRALARAGVPDREATPVVIDHAVSRADQTVLFADADGLGSVGAFADRGKARDALRTLRAPASDPIRISGQALSLAVGTDGFYEGAQHPVDLAMVLLHDDGTVASVPVETLPAGTSSPRPVTVAVGCDPGCVLTGWKIITSPANAGQGRIRIQDLRSDTGTPIPLGSADDWRGVPAGESKLDALDAEDGSLTVFVDNAGASELDLDHRWLPASLPAVVAGSLPPGSGKTYFTAHGLDGIDRSMTVAARLPWLPASGPNATVTDLALAERSGTFLSEDAVLQVWCGRSDAAFLHLVRTALAGSGLAITSEARTSDARRELDDSAATWSLRLGIVVGLVCLLVALLGLAIAGAGAWRARLRDLAVLRLNGVARAGVRRVAAVEQVPLLLVSVVLGAVVGMVAAHYALPTLPLLAVDPQVNLTDLSPAWGVVLVLTAAAGAILGVAGCASARAVADAAGPTRVGDLP